MRKIQKKRGVWDSSEKLLGCIKELKQKYGVADFYLVKLSEQGIFWVNEEIQNPLFIDV